MGRKINAEKDEGEKGKMGTRINGDQLLFHRSLSLHFLVLNVLHEIRVLK